MSQLCWYRVWDGSHERFRRTVFILAVIDLFIISSIITYVGISLWNVAVVPDGPVEQLNHRHTIDNETHSEFNGTAISLCGNDASEDYGCQNVTSKFLDKIAPTPYFALVGRRIAKSIQLIIYTCQLFMTVLLIRGLHWTDTQSMRTWLIVTEIITTIILLVLVLVLFGNFNFISVLITCGYLIYQYIMIRTVARFIRRTEIELTQFGSIVDF
ncbi:hypothetical protein Ocin01_04485 [Orchesella cincta]|uniref:Uncharacterized protein n=1 Tax=Orchesella cincta TaxID=48709 RepID=A0A1D2NAB9_ORCCI|nr:hypothetical protein Ocin01_04485 [Orchesella cincta]